MTSPTALTLFKIASVLTEPACKTREIYYQIRLMNEMGPVENRILETTKLVFQMIGCFLAAIVVTLPAAALRAVAVRLQSSPFTYMPGDADEKQALDNNIFKMFSWNVRCMPGGFSLTEGGVAPWRGRMEGIINKIRGQEDVDVLCLSEVHDYHAALRLFEGLKDCYAHFYFNIGAKGWGPNSGLFVASKLPITQPSFHAFPSNQLVGRARGVAMGFFKFMIPGGTNIVTTQLQPSHMPAHSEDEESEARNLEKRQILETIDPLCWEESNNSENYPRTIVTGDLNLGAHEYLNNWQDKFNHAAFLLAARDTSQDTIQALDEVEDTTWKGDQWYALRVGKGQVSRSLTLDYTIAYKDSAQSIDTVQIDGNFNAEQYSPEAISDHNGLLSTIVLNQRNEN